MHRGHGKDNMFMTGLLILWLLFAAWVIHDAEEYFFFERLSTNKDTRIKSIAAKFSVPKGIMQNLATSQKQEGLAIIMIGLVLLAGTLAGYLNPGGIGMRFYGVVLGGTFLHTFSHVGGTIILRKYTPGVVTAITVVLPACIVIYITIFEQQLLGIVEAIVLAVVGIVAFAPILFLVQRVAKKLAGG